jgi:microcystin-dependent protein
MANLNSGDNLIPGVDISPAQTTGGKLYVSGALSSPVNMAPQALAPTGGSLPHNNLQPYLVVLFCIAMQGVFPARP